MEGIDLFAGAGGMSLGAEWAGVKVRYAVDSNRHAVATYVANHPRVSVLPHDIAGLGADSLKNKLSSPSIIFGGPPCQGFSTSNQRTRSTANPTNWLFRHYIRLVSSLRPDWVVFENVKGILETSKGFFLRTVEEALVEAGYSISRWLLDAKDFGIPQRRWRLFVIGSLAGVNIPQPLPTHTVPLSVREAIADLPVLRNGASIDVMPYRSEARSEYAQSLRKKLTRCGNHLVTRSSFAILDRYRHVPQGGNWADIPKSLMENYTDVERCHTGIYRRLDYDEPSTVIGNFRKNMLIHPSQTRGLSVREAARLQSFPDSYVFTGTIGLQQQQVGNAVPPMLAKTVFKAILQSSGSA